MSHHWYDLCLRAYDEHCRTMGKDPSDAERQTWIDEWRELEAQDHEAAVEAYQVEQARYFKDGV